MFKLLPLFALMAASGVAQAGYVAIDDFSINQGPISDTTLNGTPVVSTLAGVRTISSNFLSGLLPYQNTVTVDSGILDITNGTGDDSEVILTWNINPNLVPAGSTNLSFSALVVQSDGNPMDVAFTLNNVTLLSSFIPPNTFNSPLSFGINLADIAGGGVLSMRLNGAAGWDLAMDTFGISFNEPPSGVPEPGSVALLGLGLLGLGLTRRRKV